MSGFLIFLMCLQLMMSVWPDAGQWAAREVCWDAVGKDVFLLERFVWGGHFFPLLGLCSVRWGHDIWSCCSNYNTMRQPTRGWNPMCWDSQRIRMEGAWDLEDIIELLDQFLSSVSSDLLLESIMCMSLLFKSLWIGHSVNCSHKYTDVLIIYLFFVSGRI